MASVLAGDGRLKLPNPVTRIFPSVGQGGLLISENIVYPGCGWFTHVTAKVDSSNKVEHFHVSIFDDNKKKVGKISWNFSHKTNSYEPVPEILNKHAADTWIANTARANFEYWMYNKADKHASKIGRNLGEVRIKLSMPPAVEKAQVTAQSARQAAYLAQQAAAVAAKAAAAAPTTID